MSLTKKIQSCKHSWINTNLNIYTDENLLKHIHTNIPAKLHAYTYKKL